MLYYRYLKHYSSEHGHKEGHGIALTSKIEGKVAIKNSYKSSAYTYSSCKKDKSKDEDHYDFEVGEVIDDRYKVANISSYI
jgi:hypothetical protein